MPHIARTRVSDDELTQCRALAQRMEEIVADGTRNVFYAVVKTRNGLALPTPIVVAIPPEVIEQLARNIRSNRLPADPAVIPVGG